MKAKWNRLLNADKKQYIREKRRKRILFQPSFNVPFLFCSKSHPNIFPPRTNMPSSTLGPGHSVASKLRQRDTEVVCPKWPPNRNGVMDRCPSSGKQLMLLLQLLTTNGQGGFNLALSTPSRTAKRSLGLSLRHPNPFTLLPPFSDLVPEGKNFLFQLFCDEMALRYVRRTRRRFFF